MRTVRPAPIAGRLAVVVLVGAGPVACRGGGEPERPRSIRADAPGRSPATATAPPHASPSGLTASAPLELPDDPDALTAIALRDGDQVRRLTAVTRLGSQPHLGRVMAEARDPAVRRVAVLNLTDPSLLQRALQDSDPVVRARAAAKAGGAALLTEMARVDPDPRTAESAVHHVTDPSALAEIASSAVTPEARRRALERISDPDVQARLAGRAGVDPARFFHVARDPATRAFIVMSLPPGSRRDSLSHHLTLAEWELVARKSNDPALAARARDAIAAAAAQERIRAAGEDIPALAEALKAAPRSHEGTMALGRLESEALAQIALQAVDSGVRAQAAARIDDAEDVLRVYAASRDARVRAALHPRLEQIASGCPSVGPEAPSAAPPALAAPEDEDALLARARGSGPIADRQAAIRRLTSQDALFALAASDALPAIRAAAAATLTHTHLLIEVLRRERVPEVRAAAVTRLTDPATLADLARRDSTAEVRRAALCNSRDPALWEHLATHEPDPELRAVAARVARARAVLKAGAP